MEKESIVITIRGGNIQHIGASKEIDVIIIDHDNLEQCQTVEEIDNELAIRQPDLILSKEDIDTTVKIINKDYNILLIK
jgi:hypothetical protein